MKRLLLALSIIIVSVLMMNVKAEAVNGNFGGGTGTELDPYLIEDVEDLKELNNYLGVTYNNTYFKLVNDIDLSSEVWVPIGNYSEQAGSSDERFYGQFNGNDKTIINLQIDRNEDYQGLFGIIKEAEIKNLLLKDAEVNGEYYVGGIVGVCDDSKITNCFISGTVSGKDYVGGIVGYSYLLEINGCTVNGDISGNNTVGGIVGVSNSSEITDCTVNGNISGNNNVGGIVGKNVNNFDNDGIVKLCISNGTVSGNNNVGGIVGENSYNGIVTLCISNGTVSGNDIVGGIVGFNMHHITKCLSIADVSGEFDLGRIAGYNDNYMSSNYADEESKLNGEKKSSSNSSSLNGADLNCKYYQYNLQPVTIYDDITDTEMLRFNVNKELFFDMSNNNLNEFFYYHYISFVMDKKQATPDELIFQKGTGNITIYKTSDNTVFQTLSVTDTAISINGSIVSIEHLPFVAGESYYVKVDNGTIVDDEGIGVTGITDTTTWTFTVETITQGPPCGNGAYVITPVSDTAYTITSDNPTLITINSGYSGFKTITVDITTSEGHQGEETIIFVHLRNGVQININAIGADIETVNKAKASFNVESGDIIKVFIVDNLTNDQNLSSLIL